MVKKSVAKVAKASNVLVGQIKDSLNTQNILSGVIVVLLVIYMSFVTSSNVPKIFNNIIVKFILFAIIVYTFFQDKLVALILAITVILSISLASKSIQSTDVQNSVTENEPEDTLSETPPQAYDEPLDEVSNFQPVNSLSNSQLLEEESYAPSQINNQYSSQPQIDNQSVEISYNTANPRVEEPSGVPSQGLEITNYCNA